MSSQSRFYMSRVVKLGQLNTQAVIEAIQNPASVQIRTTKYTFTDSRVFGPKNSPAGIYARLAKYRADGSVDVVRDESHAVEKEDVENLIEASSPFVYLPAYSGIAYKHVWNSLPREQFERAFCELVEASKQKFFVRCELETVTDLRTFVARLARLEKMTVLQATVKPPNPLFGPCWRSLAEYLKKRQLEEIQIEEQAQAGIATNLPKIAALVANTALAPNDLQEMMEPLLDGVGDAALLMAADGYGRAKIVGRENDHVVTIRTSENQKSFLISKDATPDELLKVATEEFSKISQERHLEHP
jgi:hypothetical protein